MSKEYNELEQLVNDVTNIDTARMTLRWALERLNSVEKEKAELKKNLTISEEARKGLEIKTGSLEESVRSRGRALDEKEDFYGKLEATMALLGEGKLDIQQLLKKEAKLDHLRKELEDEYQNKFEDLDRNQNSVIARWNQRLLDVEGQYAKRLSEAQNRYDSLRSGLEADYQGRLGALEKTYQLKEKELAERIRSLEASVKAGEGALEGRRKELEAGFIAKKNEVESNYSRLQSLLQANLDDRVRSLDGDHAAQVRSLEQGWNAERARLLEETRIRDEQFGKAQEEIAALRTEVSARQEKHHAELMEVISKKEEAFRNEKAALEKDKAAYEAAARKLMAQLEQREGEWLAEKEKFHAEFSRRCAETEASRLKNDLSIEEDRAALKAEFEKAFKAREAGLLEELEKARKEIEDLSAENRQAGEHLLDKEAKFNREMVEIKAGYERELGLRIKDSVEAQTAHLLEALEAAKKKNEEAQALVSAREAEMAAFKAEAAEKDRRFEEDRVRELDSKIRGAVAKTTEALGEKLAAAEDAMMKLQRDHMDECRAMQDGFEKEKERVVEDMRRRKSCIEAGDVKIAQLETEMTKLRQDSAIEMHNRLVQQEDKFNALIRDYQARQEKLEKEMEERSASAIARATEAFGEKLAAAEDAMMKLQRDHMDECRAMQDGFEKEKERLVEDMRRRESCIEAGDVKIAQLETEMTKLRQDSAIEMHNRLVQQEDKFNALIRDYQARQEKLEKEMEERSASAIARATEALGERLCAAEEAMLKLQKDHMDECRSMQDGFEKEKERVVEELHRRKSCIEAGDLKIAQLETEMTKLRQDSAIEMHNRLVQQEDKFNALIKDYQARQEKLEKEMEERSASAIARATEALGEKLAAAEDAMMKLQRDHMDECRSMQDGFEKEKERVVEDMRRRESCIEAGDLKIAQLETEMTKLRQDSAIEMHNRLVQQEDKFNALIKDYQARQEKLEKEMEERSASAIARATEALGERLCAAEEAMLKLQKEHMDECRSMQDGFEKEKERVVEELHRRESCIEAGDLKIAQLENEMMRCRRDSAATLLGQVSEQEDRFNALLRENQARQEKLEKEAAGKLEEAGKAHEAQLRDLEAALESKESLMREARELWTRKQIELEEKEKKLSERRMAVEKEYFARTDEIEKLKSELTRAVMEYKSRK